MESRIPAEAPGVEDVLEEVFRGAGKPILSVEDGNAVLASMSALPEKVQTELLLEAIAPPAPATGSGGHSGVGEAEWVAGRAEALDLEDEAGFPPALFDVLVRRRNAAWTLWLEERLKKPGTLLFAVGAGHLAGPRIGPGDARQARASGEADRLRAAGLIPWTH